MAKKYKTLTEQWAAEDAAKASAKKKSTPAKKAAPKPQSLRDRVAARNKALRDT